MFSQKFRFTPSGKQSHGLQQEVVLLDEGWDATVYVAVGLRNEGCAVHIVTAADGDEHPDAKYLGPRITCEAVPPVCSQGYVRAIGTAIASRQSSTVLALTEAIMYRLWAADPAWLQRIRPDCPEWQRALLRDKARLSEYVAHAGVRIPEQRPISPAGDRRAAIRAFGLPVVVKGTSGRGGGSVRIANTEQAALDAVAEFAKKGRCFLQKYVAGPTFLVGGLFRDGQPIRIYAGEKIECAHPTGPSFRQRSEDDPALVAFALAVFRALRWSGLAQVDIVRHPDGEYFFIECNPRPWGSIAASARAGVDLFGPLAGLLAGRIPEPDLSFTPDRRTTLFPQVAVARLRNGGARSLTSLVREPHIWLDAPWSDPGLVAHLARQLWWSWRDGTLERASATPEPVESDHADLEAEVVFEGMPAVHETESQ